MTGSDSERIYSGAFRDVVVLLTGAVALTIIVGLVIEWLA